MKPSFEVPFRSLIRQTAKITGSHPSEALPEKQKRTIKVSAIYFILDLGFPLDVLSPKNWQALASLAANAQDQPARERHKLSESRLPYRN
jgi:hypothetical protein